MHKMFTTTKWVGFSWLIRVNTDLHGNLNLKFSLSLGSHPWKWEMRKWFDFERMLTWGIHNHLYPQLHLLVCSHNVSFVFMASSHLAPISWILNFFSRSGNNWVGVLFVHCWRYFLENQLLIKERGQFMMI